MSACPFCDLSDRVLLYESDLVVAFGDLFPVSKGHTLVIPKRHAETYFDLTSAEQQALWRAVSQVKQRLDATLDPKPDGYNVGFNALEAAGQTVAHAHVHVIPRYRGDVQNPRGGVRWVIPSKADYKLDFDSARPQDVADVAAGPTRALGPWLRADLAHANRIDVAVAFVWPTGLDYIYRHLEECLERRGSVRFLTGDYADLTSPEALRRLLDLTQYEGMTLRVFESGRAGVSFHPKVYLISGDRVSQSPIAYIGSSNLSDQALTKGYEWNARLQGVAGVRRAAAAFAELFRSSPTREVTHEWVDAYEKRRETRTVNRESDALSFDEPAREPFEPHGVQQEALEALDATRREGNTAGLVVLATGLGKTWLAAFDSRPFKRVLFVAHREEILRQAVQTFRALRPNDRFGLYTGSDKHLGANVLFAGVQTLARKNHRERFDPGYFDYIVIDEFHHATARTYSELIRYFRPKFLLGLTATPDRSDGGDLLGLCDDNLVYQCDLGRGIQGEFLAPFNYHGVPDPVDYETIPWRSRRFDEARLTEEVATQERAHNALEQWRKYAGEASRTIGFCVSQVHADFMREYFDAAGLRARSVHSNKSTSDSREASLLELEAGEIDILFAVDMFNEGLDIKNVDAVLMLRPTESKILWLQQIGRGLRKSPGKERLEIIDYIGNHRTFLQKPAALFGALGMKIQGPRDILSLIKSRGYEDVLPPGCAVTYELEAVDLFEKLFRNTKSIDAIVEWYRAFEETNGVRPTALQAQRAGRNPRSTVKEYGSWLSFVESEGGLDDVAIQVRRKNDPFLRELETTPMTRGYKMYLLEALLWLDALPGEASVDALVEAFVEMCGRSALRRRDVSVDLDDRAAVRRLLLSHPIQAWIGRADPEGRPYFELDRGAIRSGDGIRPVADDREREALVDLVAEVVEWRVAQYLADRRSGIRFKVRRTKTGEPILKLDRGRHDLPEKGSWVEVDIDGEPYRVGFQKQHIDVVEPLGESGGETEPTNALPGLLYGWFGKDAGARGTQHSVAHDLAPGGGYRWKPATTVAGSDSEGEHVRRDDGTLVDAKMLVQELDGIPTVIVMSRGGGGRNDQYAEGVEILLRRLGALGAKLSRVAVESGATTSYDLEGRTLRIDGFEYSIDPSGVDARELRLAIGKAGAAIGRAPGAKGSGNPNKKIRLWVEGCSLDALRDALGQ